MKKLAGLTLRGVGKVGDVVMGRDYEGKTTVRGYQPNVANPQTEGQRAQRSKIGVLGALAKNLTPYFKVVQRVNRGKISPTASFNSADNQALVQYSPVDDTTVVDMQALTVRVGNDIIPLWTVQTPVILEATDEYSSIEVGAVTTSDNRIVNGDTYECWLVMNCKENYWIGTSYSTVTATNNTCAFSGFVITADNYKPVAGATFAVTGVMMYNTRTGESFSPPRNGKAVTLV